MIEKVHSHILAELKSNTQTDRIFVLSAMVLNFITLFINSMISSSRGTNLITMFVFVGLTIAVNVVSEIGLLKGKQTRLRLLSGLMKMYEDNNVEQYYDANLLSSYATRYNLFMLIILITGLVAIIVPFINL